MLEAVRVRREGFAYRPFFSDFVSDYKRLVFKMSDKVLTDIVSTVACCYDSLFSSGGTNRLYTLLKKHVKRY